MKQPVLNNTGSPGGARAESSFADFSALNVPVDDGFFFGSDSQSFSSNHLNGSLSFQQLSIIQNDQQQQLPGLQISSQFKNHQSFDSNNINNNAHTDTNIDDVTFHQPFQHNSVEHVLQPNRQQSQSMLNNAEFDYSSFAAMESNFVNCQPSTSTAQIVTTHNALSSQQTQNYQVIFKFYISY